MIPFSILLFAAVHGPFFGEPQFLLGFKLSLFSLHDTKLLCNPIILLLGQVRLLKI